jgi:hypothetical protein
MKVNISNVDFKRSKASFTIDRRQGDKVRGRQGEINPKSGHPKSPIKT